MLSQRHLAPESVCQSLNGQLHKVSNVKDSEVCSATFLCQITEKNFVLSVLWWFCRPLAQSMLQTVLCSSLILHSNICAHYGTVFPRLRVQPACRLHNICSKLRASFVLHRWANLRTTEAQQMTSYFIGLSNSTQRANAPSTLLLCNCKQCMGTCSWAQNEKMILRFLIWEAIFWG